MVNTLRENTLTGTRVITLEGGILPRYITNTAIITSFWTGINKVDPMTTSDPKNSTLIKFKGNIRMQFDITRIKQIRPLRNMNGHIV